jgi:pyrroline-5-carboxylate reductase
MQICAIVNNKGGFMKTISFIGGGRITRIMIGGLKNTGYHLDTITVYDSNKEALGGINKQFGAVRIADDIKILKGSAVVVIALHPQALVESSAVIQKIISDETFVLSLVPKIKMSKTVELLGGHQKTARMNPNAPSLVNKGFNPIAFSKACTDSDKNNILNIFGPLGDMPFVDDHLIESFAVITAMGPTYVDYQIAALFENAKKFGIPDELAVRGIVSMLNGAALTVLRPEPGYDVFDLVPARPLKEIEAIVSGAYKERLPERYAMLTG